MKLRKTKVFLCKLVFVTLLSICGLFLLEYSREHLPIPELFLTSTSSILLQQNFPHRTYEIPKILQRSVNSSSLYTHYDIGHPFPIDVKDQRSTYTVRRNTLATLCVIEGTDLKRQGHGCTCKGGWYGTNCGIPEGVYLSSAYKGMKETTSLRETPRRVIHAVPFNMEFDMLEARFMELEGVVDVYVILESNYSAAGVPKPRRFLERLRRGHYHHLQHKILYVHLGYFPEAAYKDGWVIDDLLRDYIGLVGLKKLNGLKQDDIFLLSDADELPRRNEVLFLKLHDGFPEPVGFHLHFTTYGFFYYSPNRPSMGIPMATTIDFLYSVLEGKASRVRNPEGHLPRLKKKVEMYVSKGGRKVQLWFLGDKDKHPVGWHCSWCFNVSNMQIKLTSAQLSDKPRWGNYPDKLKPEYLESLIRNGAWFDGSRGLRFVSPNHPLYAPHYVMSYPSQYMHLLWNVYLKGS